MISFVDDVGSLSLKQKRVFYMLLGNNLTTSIRCIFSENQADEPINDVKAINEVIHRSLNRLFDLESGENSWSEEDVWGTIKNVVNLNPSILKIMWEME